MTGRGRQQQEPEVEPQVESPADRLARLKIENELMREELENNTLRARVANIRNKEL